MAERFEKYFDECKAKEKTPTISGLAVACEIDGDTLQRYSYRPAFAGLVKAAKTRVMASMEDLLMLSRANAGVIFAMKNRFAWADKTEVLSLSLYATMSEDDLKTKIRDMQGHEGHG